MPACKLSHGFLYSIKYLRNLAWPYFYAGTEYRRNMEDRPDALYSAFAADSLMLPTGCQMPKSVLTGSVQAPPFSLFHVFHGMGYLQNEHKNMSAAPPR